MMKAVLVLSAVMLCFGIAHAKKDVCKITGKGKLTTFSGTKALVKMPCKYQATTFRCQGYKVHVAPGQAFDSKARYFTNTLWVSIQKLKTGFYWKGRTSTKRVSRFFNGSAEAPFNTKEEELDGAPFSIAMNSDAEEYSVTLGTSDSELEVKFYAYDENDKLRRKRAGVEITCPDADFTDSGLYPDSLCGNETYVRAVRDRKKEISMGTKTKTLMYDILNNALVAQTNPQCDAAFYVFSSCPDKQTALKSCSSLVSNNKVMKCLNKFLYDPMDVFIYCMKYACNNDSDACDLLNEAMDGCYKPSSLPKGDCPKTGIDAN